MPIRIQRKRVKGWKMPPDTIYVGRPTRLGNPFIVGRRVDTEIGAFSAEFLNVDPAMIVHDASHAVALYRLWWEKNYPQGAEFAPSVMSARGKNLACWCPEGQPCHADVLLELANS